MKKELFGLNMEEILAAIKPLGFEKYRARQIAEWMYQRCVSSFSDMTNLSKQQRELLAQHFTLTQLQPLRVQKSDDKETTKFLLELPDKMTVESVLMRHHYGNSICISTQVGCAMGCAFCASTLKGLERNLSAGEILAQVLFVNKMLLQEGQNINSIVIMGSGEPLANYQEVLKFIRLVHEEYCLHLSYRSITLSTCGIVPAIKRLTQENIPITLAISLHSARNEIRSQLMPINQTYPIEEVLNAADDYAAQTGRRVTYEYILIADKNDSKEDAALLAKLLHGRLANVNLIPVNTVRERGMLRPAAEVVDRFEQVLLKHHINVTVRREMGADIQAACGQLRNNFHTENNVKNGLF